MSEERKEAIWYLKVLQKEYSHWQVECRNALDYAIKELESKEPVKQVAKK